MRLKIGSRKSDLARIQAYQVGEALRTVAPNLEIEYDFRESLGDLNQNDPLWKMPAQGVFTADFHKGLIEGRWDLVVHSWKDLPVEATKGTRIAATLPRADSRDLLLVPKNYAKSSFPKKLCVLTSSPRRQHNLQDCLADLLPFSCTEITFRDIRGNILTRVDKLLSGEHGDALVLAKAAVDRILLASRPEFEAARQKILSALELCHWMVLPSSVNPSAAAQGALAVEAANANAPVLELLAKINCMKSYAIVEEERRLHKSFGGGCHQKIGVSLLDHPEGCVYAIRGEPRSGKSIQHFSFSAFDDTPNVYLRENFFLRESERRKKLSDSSTPRRLWPEQGSSPQIFDRESIESVVDFSDFSGYLITRERALPIGFVSHESAVIWTSGIKSWQALARRGIWVHGTLDGLGEATLPMSFAWGADGKKFNWCKFSHEAAPESKELASITTYRLVPRENDTLDLTKYDTFFWMSGSQFLQALAKFPNIRDRNHSCGPGNTLAIIRQELGLNANIGVFVGIEEWRNFYESGK